MFELEKGLVLRDLVLEILREGPKSISQVGAGLRERGLKLHRLAVAGYLKALADQEVLDEREIPPAKVYAVRPSAGQRDLHRRVAEAARAHGGLDPGRLYLQALTDLFHRPIFLEELKRGGHDVPAGAAEADGEERQAARRFLSKSTLKLPFNDPAYVPRHAKPEDERAMRDASRAVLAAIVRDDYRAGLLAMTTKQSTLGDA